MINLAIVGATGEVGRTALSILEESEMPIGQLFLLASARSAGTELCFRGKRITVELASDFDPKRADFALFSAGSETSATLAPKFAAAGCIVVDNSSFFRYDDDKLLVVPEVNGDLLQGAEKGSIIANPNCSTIQLVVALKPIQDAAGLERLNVCTYQAVSGAGRKGIDALTGAATRESAFTKPIKGNVIPHIDRFEENGYTREEMKVVRESRKILRQPELQVNVTAVRVPVLTGHSISAHIETTQKITAKEATELLSRAPGIRVFTGEDYPTPLNEGQGTDQVYVGRIREDISHPRGLNLWIVADNLRKGAALNALQIIEQLKV